MQVPICISADPRLPRLRDRFGFLLRVIRLRGHTSVRVALLCSATCLHCLPRDVPFNWYSLLRIQLRGMSAMSSATALGREATQEHSKTVHDTGVLDSSLLRTLAQHTWRGAACPPGMPLGVGVSLAPQTRAVDSDRYHCGISGWMELKMF